MTPVEQAIRLLKTCTANVQVTSPHEALVQVTDADIMITIFDAVERQVGYRMDLEARAGGYCILTVGPEGCNG